MRYRNRLVFFIMLSGYFEDCLLSRFATTAPDIDMITYQKLNQRTDLLLFVFNKLFYPADYYSGVQLFS